MPVNPSQVEDLKQKNALLSQNLQRVKRDQREREVVFLEAIQRIGTLYASVHPSIGFLVTKLNQDLKARKTDSINEILTEISKLGKSSAAKQGPISDLGISALRQAIQSLSCTDAERQSLLDELEQPNGVANVVEKIKTLSTSQPNNAIDQLRQPLQKALLSIINVFDVPETMSEQRQTLSEKISSDWPIETLPELLAEAVQFSQACGEAQRHSQQELENTLLHFSQEIGVFQGYVRGNQDDIRIANSRRNTIQKQLTGEFDGMETDMQDAVNIDELRQMMTSRIGTVKSNMDRYTSAEATRLSAAEQRNQELEIKLQELEKESQGLRLQLDDTNQQLLTDTLTGVSNRFAYEKQFASLLADGKSAQPLCYAVMDIDFFKRINDNYGHKSGDKVLTMVATVIQKCVPESHFFARIGGEEFALLMPNTDLTQAKEVCEIVRANVEKSGFNHRGKAVSISISIGMTQAQDKEEGDDIYERADKALYRAKEGGRNQVVCADDDTAANAA